MAEVEDGAVTGLIGGRYKIVRLIGRGGMGSVWLAKDTLLGRQVAVKQIGALPGETEREAERAMREARSAAALNHPNMVVLYDAIKHEGEPWLVMEYVSGPTLAAWVREHGPLEPEVVAEIGARLASGLAAAHRAGIVHRDIKPANVFMADDGEPKIGDFGTARGASDDQLTLAGVVTGTPSYMAPEVADGGEHAEAADVWALGATLYFAVEGEDAYPGTGNALATLRTIATKPPRPPERAGGLESILAQTLAHTASRRGSMHEVMRRLEAIAPGRPGAIPMAGAGAGAGAGAAAGAGGAAAAAAAEDEETVARFVGQEGEGASGLFGFPAEPERKRRRKDKATPLLIGLAAAWVIGAAGIVAFALDDGKEQEATPPTTTSTSSESSTSSTSSTTSTTREPTSETTTEEVVPPPPPPTQAPPPQPTSEPAPPPQTSEAPPPETTTTPEPTETTSESSSESSSPSSSSTSSEPTETEPSSSSSSSMTTEPPPETTSEPTTSSSTSSESRSPASSASVGGTE